ncbi:hypothetical protein G6M50_28435 [Agrobacterium rhizogenes]|nr:hypothetical protein [Rhizobium rhizogenes]NTJ81721.1 hypothetical protein [Rhizobium rhizogenes]
MSRTRGSHWSAAKAAPSLGEHRIPGAAITLVTVAGRDATASTWCEETKPVSMSRRRFSDAEWPPSSPSLDLASTAPNGLFNGLIWPKAGCASIAYDATAASNFLPLPAAPLFLARQESPP